MTDQIDLRSLTAVESQLSSPAQLLAALIEVGNAAGSPAELLRRCGNLVANLDVVALRSGARETATHFVWKLVEDTSTGAGLYLNEYKDLTGGRSVGYATSIHNHRYDFASSVLSGGFVETRYRVEANADRVREVTEIDRHAVSSSQTYAIGSNEFHALSEVVPGSVTLVLKARARKNHSYSVSSNHEKLERHEPVEQLAGGLPSRLFSAASAVGPGELSEDGHRG